MRSFGGAFMLIELIILLIMGIAFLIIGWLIWKKEKITLIHEYHWDKVSEENKAAYTAMIGKGTLLIGIGMILTGVIDYLTHTGWGWVSFGACFIIGLTLMILAGIRYNRG